MTSDEIPAESAVREACMLLEVAQLEACLAALQHDGVQGNGAQSVRAVASGCLAYAAGNFEEAARQFAHAGALDVPLPALLRERARHAKRMGDWDAALHLYVRLDASQPGAIHEFAHDAPPAQAQRIAAWGVGGLRGGPPRIYQAQPSKRALVDCHGEEGAAFIWSQLLRPGQAWRLAHLPLDGLHRFAKRHALEFEELAAPREAYMAPPAVFAGPQLPGVSGRTRSVFFCVLPDIVVTSKSNLLLANDRVLMDVQDGEWDQVEVNLDADPLVLSARDTTLAVLDVPENVRRAPLEQAFSLVGIHTWNYGHWLFEFMFQVWACMDRPGFAQVPLIVDEQMPAQLREALAFFVGDDHPMVVLKPGESVRVKRLWTCSRIAYWPGGERPGGAYPWIGELSDSPRLARLLQRLGPQLDALGAPTKGGSRIFLRRKDNQKRRIANRRELEGWFEAQGFELLDFDELSFADQVRRIRHADVVVGPDGASFFNMLFARPGTRIGTFSQPVMEGYEWWGQVFRELGLPMLSYPGKLHKLNAAYRSQSDMWIDLADMPGYLARLLAMPLHRGDPDPALPPIRVGSEVPAPGGAIDVGAAHTGAADAASAGNAWQHAHAAFVAGRFADALGLLEPVPQGHHPIGRMLCALARAGLARTQGDAGGVRHWMEAAAATHVPLLHGFWECGRHDKESGRYDRAYVAISALDQVRPGSIGYYWQGLPAEWRRKYAPAVMGEMLRAARPPFYELQRLKSELVGIHGEHGAAMIYASAFAPSRGWVLRRLPLAGLQDYARRHALEYEELVAPKEVLMRPPQVYGQGQGSGEGFTGHTRSFFFCILPEIVVFGKSNLTMAPDCMLLDFQGDELERIPLNYDTHPPVVSAAGGLLAVVDSDSGRPVIDDAFNLTGLHTFNFGHWVFEYMFQVWAVMARKDLRPVTFLIDRQMPDQLRRMLEFFVPQATVHVVEPGGSVMVRRLWTCSKIAFWPGGEKLPAPPVHDYELSDTDALAAILRGLQGRLAAVDSVGYPPNLYLTRSNSQGRPLVNREEVEQHFRRRGFAVVDFNEVTFVEQLRHLRAARTVIMEAGSSMYGLLFAAPGTRIGEIISDHAEHEWCAEMFRSLGQLLVIFPCETVGTLSNLNQSPVMKVDVAELDRFIDFLQTAPVPQPKG